MTHTICSDHDPIVLDLLNNSFSRKNFRFRFKNVWLKEPNVSIEVSNFWMGIPSVQLLPKLISIFTFMAKWERNFFHKFRDKIKKQKEVPDALVNISDESGVHRYFEEKNHLDDLMKQEEVYWLQRAKAFWLTEGDKNTKFFHAQASARKKPNHIDYLKTPNDEKVVDHEKMCDMTVTYFKEIFNGGTGIDNRQDNAGVHRMNSENQNSKLVKELQFEEFTSVIKQMHLDKVSGPDGLDPVFFQHFWGLIGSEIF